MNSTPPIPESENLSRYHVESRREIISILRGLKDSGQLVSMIIDNGNEVIITAILEVDDFNNVFILDRPSTEAATQRLLKAPRVYFETTLNKISIRFSAAGVALRAYRGNPSLVCVIPPILSRLQRREYYRVSVPISHPIFCAVPLPEDRDGVLVKLSIIDISCRGILVSDDKQMLNVELGTMYGSCEIDLPGIGRLSVTIQIRNSYDLVLRDHKVHRRIGCELMDLSQKEISQIQKFITKIERERNARQTGLE